MNRTAIRKHMPATTHAPTLIDDLRALSSRWTDLANTWARLDPDSIEGHVLRFCAHELHRTAEYHGHRENAPHPA